MTTSLWRGDDRISVTLFKPAPEPKGLAAIKTEIEQRWAAKQEDFAPQRDQTQRPHRLTSKTFWKIMLAHVWEEACRISNN
jgi:hypothetical protein